MVYVLYTHCALTLFTCIQYIQTLLCLYIKRKDMYGVGNFSQADGHRNLALKSVSFDPRTRCVGADMMGTVRKISQQSLKS
jgi:hypothetical protein